MGHGRYTATPIQILSRIQSCNPFYLVERRQSNQLPNVCGSLTMAVGVERDSQFHNCGLSTENQLQNISRKKNVAKRSRKKKSQKEVAKRQKHSIIVKGGILASKPG
jgi:hypothetical protein